MQVLIAEDYPISGKLRDVKLQREGYTDECRPPTAVRHGKR